MKFSEITGHKKEIERLIALADQGRLPHALLLHGPSGVGKMMTARALVQYLYCTDRHDGDSCGVCPACRQIAALNHPDIHYVYPVLRKGSNKPVYSTDYFEQWSRYITEFPYMPAEQWLEAIEAGNGRPVIYVSEAEEIVRLASLSSYGDGLKIFLIWQPEKMNIDTANKLLKMIEEPFADTLFILVSNNPRQLLPTVRSRLQGVEFGPIAEEDLAAYFEREGFGAADARDYARISQGDMNRAFRLAHDNGELRQFASDFMGVMRACYARKIVELKDYADTFAGYGREKSIRLLEYFARMTRESFISNIDSSRQLLAMTGSEAAFVEKFGPFIHAANVEQMSREYDQAISDISRNANQKIVWFDLLLTLCRLIRSNNK